MQGRVAIIVARQSRGRGRGVSLAPVICGEITGLEQSEQVLHGLVLVLDHLRLDYEGALNVGVLESSFKCILEKVDIEV